MSPISYYISAIRQIENKAKASSLLAHIFATNNFNNNLKHGKNCFTAFVLLRQCYMMFQKNFNENKIDEIIAIKNMYSIFKINQHSNETAELTDFERWGFPSTD